MSSTVHEARLDREGKTTHSEARRSSEPRLPTRYVPDPRTEAVQLVEADAESAARWVAWTQWYGRPVTGERDEAHYAGLDVIPADEIARE